MSVHLILVQAIGFFGTILFFLSYQFKSNKTLFRVQFVSYVCYTVHLLLLGATIGGYTYNAKTIRMVGLCVNSPLWVIYDVAVGSWAGILDEAASSVSVLVSIARYGWKNLDAPKAENG